LTLQESIKRAAADRGLTISDLIESVGPPSKILDEFQFTENGSVTGIELFEILKKKFVKQAKARRLVYLILNALFKETP